MDDAQHITLADYIASEHDNLNEFAQWWSKESASDPGNFPATMNAAAWWEQYIAWVQR